MPSQSLPRVSRALIAGGLVMGVLGLTALPALGAGTAGTPTTGPVNTVGGGTIPPIKHVWTILLENSDEAATLAQDNTGSGELTSVLRSQGAFLPNYYATGHASLDNYIALAGAQGPTVKTQGDCSDDSDPIGGSKTTSLRGFDADGQALAYPADIAANRNVCTYPADVPSIGMQLSNAGYTWRTYAQGMDDEPQYLDAKNPALRTTCQSAQYAGDTNSDAANPTLAPGTPIARNYARKHDPELYFYGVTGVGGNAPTPACDKEEVGLLPLQSDLLNTNLSDTDKTPSYSLIIPDLCNDAHDSESNGVPSPPSAGGGGVTPPATAGCRPNSVGPDDKTLATDKGIAQADNFLHYWVPKILDSPAYRDNGLLMITFDEGTEAQSCCGEVKSPNLPDNASNGQSSAPSTPLTNGGGVIGMVAISPFITPGTTSTVSYNHYSYVRTIEDMFHLTPARTKSAAFPNGITGSDGQGHIGYAGSQGGSPANAPASFGTDVFDNPSGVLATPSLPDSRIAVLLPIAALMLGAGLLTRRMRRTA